MDSPALRTIAVLGLAVSAPGCLLGNPDYIDPTSEATTDAPTSMSDSSTSMTTSTSSTTVDTASTTGPMTSTSDGTSTTSTTEPTTSESTSTGVDTDVSPYCGDGNTDPGEECDDGDLDEDDECTNSCTLPACGDGFIQVGEECDNGPNNGVGDTCTDDCILNVCGDGILGLMEECDDGNLTDGDGCSKGCTQEKCGNNVIDPGESCDDGNNIDDDGCTTICAPQPYLGELVPIGNSFPLGPVMGEPYGAICNGFVVGFDVVLDNDTGHFAQIVSRCAEVKLEPIGAGVWRLRQAGPVSLGTEFNGYVPNKPVMLSTICADQQTLLAAIGGRATAMGVTEIGLQCQEVLVKWVAGAYQLQPQVPVMLPPIGSMTGEIQPKIDCLGIPGTVAWSYVANVVSGIASLYLQCGDPALSW